jgi:hypothetical protein
MRNVVMPAHRRYRFSWLWERCATEAERRGLSSFGMLVPGPCEGLYDSNRPRMDFDVREDRIVATFRLRSALRTATGDVSLIELREGREDYSAS